ARSRTAPAARPGRPPPRRHRRSTARRRRPAPRAGRRCPARPRRRRARCPHAPASVCPRCRIVPQAHRSRECGRMGLMHVLIAPDAMAPMLSATDTAAALARPWQDRGHVVRQVPMGTGASGLIEAVAAARGGDTHPVPAAAPGVVAEMLVVDSTAYVEAGPLLGGVPEVGADGLLGSTAPLAGLLLAAVGTGSRQAVVGHGHTAVQDGGMILRDA